MPKNVIKKEIQEGIKAFKECGEEMAEEIEIELVSVDKTLSKLTIKFENEDEAHPFTINVHDKYVDGDRSENIVFFSDDEELEDWYMHMVQFSTNCKELKAGIYEAGKHYFDMENQGDDDQDFYDDEEMFGEPALHATIAPKPQSSAPRMKSEDFFTGDGSKAATERLIKDLQAIAEEDTEKFGYEVDTIDDNLYLWEARLFDFDGDLAKDMKKKNIKHVKLEMRFPKDYPFSPPFIRVVEPRFAFHTGHVTIGGSICMELLTPSGWRPSNDIEGVLVQIRSEIMAGGARLDSNQRPYTEGEAKAAFDRVARQHGWL